MKYPEEIPLFPLSGVILLPNAVLPLHIFEPRYRQMLEHTVEKDNVIGMIQPSHQDPDQLYSVGGLGKIDNWQKLDNGNYLIRMTGLIRFRIVRELAVDTLYRQAQVAYQEFIHDPMDTQLSMSPEILYDMLQEYAKKHGNMMDWEKLHLIPFHFLIHLLCMNLPFSDLEKQELLESHSLSERSQILMGLLNMVVHSNADGGSDILLN